MQTYEIEMDGCRQTVTVAQFRAMLDERRAAALAIMTAFRRNDLAAVMQAQAAMRARFGSKS
jgi:hypothetical protein